LKEAAHLFIDGLKDHNMKQHLLVDGEWTFNEALSQSLMLELRRGNRSTGRTASGKG
jgi:hypothetical protein